MYKEISYIIEQDDYKHYVALNSREIPTIGGNILEGMLVYHPYIDKSKKPIGYIEGTSTHAMKLFIQNRPFSLFVSKREVKYNYNKTKTIYKFCKSNLVFPYTNKCPDVRIIDYSDPIWSTKTGHYIYDYLFTGRDEDFIQEQLRLFKEATGITEVDEFFDLPFEERQYLSWGNDVRFDLQILIPNCEITDHPGEYVWKLGEETVGPGRG